MSSKPHDRHEGPTLDHLVREMQGPDLAVFHEDGDDLVINDAATEHTEQWLHEHTQLTARTYPGMGHRISKEELVDVSAFLRHYVLRPVGAPGG